VLVHLIRPFTLRLVTSVDVPLKGSQVPKKGLKSRAIHITHTYVHASDIVRK